MDTVDFDVFDDELKSIEEIMEREEIALSDEDLDAPIQSLPLKKAVVVETGISVKKCIEKMLARKFGCLLIVKNEELRGIFTERDALMKIAGKRLDLAKVKIDDYMTPDPAHIKMNDSILSALRVMDKGSYRHIAIVDDKKRPVSVLSIKDIVTYIAEFFPQDVLNLPPHPIRIGTKNREGG
ncbi:CBS domain-containing protein [candidate division KSB1 bacterium]|nr:CBS domain-containing protein [candidate division KSB1 bacterium]